MNKTTSLPYLDRLDSGRQKIFKELASFADDFTLAGGTAIMLQNGITVIFVFHPYPPLQKPLKTGSLPYYHLDDLAANKAYTIGRRGRWRDYVDLFFLLKWKLYNLADIISMAEKKFTGEFHVKLFLQQLTFFNDLEIVPVEFIKEKYTAEEIKNSLNINTRLYLQQVLNNAG